jgi:hypothetical protein
MANLQAPPDFHGHEPRACGEHRTVGSFRAWCTDCREWCYPVQELACKGCEIGMLKARIEHLEEKK